MKHHNVSKFSLLLGIYVLTSLFAGCVVAEPHEGYYDRDHARWWHNHAWVTCDRADPHCR